MTRDELRNAINNACDIMRREGADYHGLHGTALVAAVPQALRGDGVNGGQQEIEAMTGAVLERAFQGEVLCFPPNGAV